MNHHTARGRAVKLLALHGFAASAAVWQPLAEQLTRPAHFQARDLPGHGSAPQTPAVLTLGAMATACAAALSAPAVWIGWSLGGLVALHAAYRFPEKVLGVIAVAISPRFLAAAGWPNALDPAEFVNFERALKRDGARALDRFFALQTRTRHGSSVMLTRRLRALALGGGVPRPSVLAKTLCILGSADLRDEAAALTCPLMAVLGEDDLLVPSAVGEDLVRLNPAWRIEIMEAAGHVPFLSHPAAFVSMLDSFVQAVDAECAAE